MFLQNNNHRDSEKERDREKEKVHRKITKRKWTENVHDCIKLLQIHLLQQNFTHLH